MFFSDLVIPTSYHLIDNPRKLSWFLSVLADQPHYGSDIETNHPTTKSKPLQAQWEEEAEHKICGISFAWNRTGVTDPWQPGTAAYIPITKSDDRDFWGVKQDYVWSALDRLLSNGARKNFFNNKYDVSTLYELQKIKVKNVAFDPLLAKSLIDEKGLDSSFALKSKYNAQGEISKLGCADFYLRTEGSLFKKDLDEALEYYDPKYKRYSKIPLSTLYPYGCGDSDLSLSLEFFLRPLMEEEGVLWIFDNLIMPLSQTVMRGELHGVPVDLDQAEKVRSGQKAIMDSLEGKIQEICGKTFNVGSDKQLGEVLFEHLGLPGTKNENYNWKVDTDTLRELNHPVVDHLVKYSRAKQIHNNYAVAALSRVREVTHGGRVGWVHPDQQIWSATGRIRCYDPNLATLPRPENGGDIVKSMFAGPDNYRFLLKDFSQIEMRVAAHLSQEPVWIEAFLAGADLHSATAEKVWGVSDTVHRSMAKTVNFGILYGEGAWGLARNLDVSVEEAQKIIDDYFANVPVLQQWISHQHEESRRIGYVTNMFGRRRHLPDAQIQLLEPLKWPDDPNRCYRNGPIVSNLGISIDDAYDMTPDELKSIIHNSPKKTFRSCLNCSYIKSCLINREVKYVKSLVNRAYRQAVNAPVQSSAVDMCSFSMVWMSREFQKQGIDAVALLHLHDEIFVYCHVDHVEAASNVMDYYMTDYLQKFTNFSVPLLVDTEVIYRWSEKGKG